MKSQSNHPEEPAERQLTVKDLGVLMKYALQKDNPKLQDAAIRLLAILQKVLKTEFNAGV